MRADKVELVEQTTQGMADTVSQDGEGQRTHPRNAALPPRDLQPRFSDTYQSSLHIVRCQGNLVLTVSTNLKRPLSFHGL